MDVLMISPGYPAEMPFFTMGLVEAGARVIGVGDAVPAALPERARRALSAYVQVAKLWDEGKVVEQVRGFLAGRRVDRVECLWEPGVLLAARLREALGVPGMGVEQATRFRDKEEMKQALDAAGVRTPRHGRAASLAAVEEAIEAIGFPVILKPIAGAGSIDTHRVDDRAALRAALPRLRHVAEVSVEEFVDGEEYTFDTITAGGEILYDNISWYRPRPLIARSVPWLSPQTVCLRDTHVPDLEPGRRMGRAVLRALGFDTGFTHMEWFRTPAGEAVFGEIAARPPGAKSVDIMNYTGNCDLFRGWAEAVCHGRLGQPTGRHYVTAVVFKRAEGRGRIRRIEGLAPLLAELGEALVALDLLPIGSPRRDWVQTLLSDGHAIVRHPDLDTALALADRIGTELRIVAG